MIFKKRGHSQEAKPTDGDLFKLSAFEIGLICSILVVSIAFILWTKYHGGSSPETLKYALIYKNNELLEKLDMRKDRVITLPNNEMEIEIKDGRIRVVRSTCPKQICVGLGWIEHPGEVNVCVPNRVLIEVVSSGLPELDAVVR